MRVIICPEVYVPGENDYVIFMAGGITGCPDWQSEVIAAAPNSRLNSLAGLMGCELVLINPRRPDFDTSKSESSVAQIRWEHKHLKMANAIYFWFPKEGMCAITLFELGAALGEDRPVTVGVEPGYLRELDVREQFALRSSDKICDNLGEMYLLDK